MYRFITLSALLIMIGTACVPARKYEELEEKYKKSIEDAELYKNEKKAFTESEKNFSHFL